MSKIQILVNNYSKLSSHESNPLTSIPITHMLMANKGDIMLPHVWNTEQGVSSKIINGTFYFKKITQKGKQLSLK